MENIPKYSILESGTARIFVESSHFKKQIDDIGKDLLRVIQLEILRNPEKGSVVEGTGGVRKIRIAKNGGGKSGGYRVLYLDLPKRGVCHLLLIFAKGDKANISAADKKVIRGIVDKLKD